MAATPLLVWGLGYLRVSGRVWDVRVFKVLGCLGSELFGVESLHIFKKKRKELKEGYKSTRFLSSFLFSYSDYVLHSLAYVHAFFPVHFFIQ